MNIGLHRILNHVTASDMEKDFLVSPTGDKIPVKIYDNFRFPHVYTGNVADHMQELKEMECRDDDVFIMSYPKSGNHWVREIVHMIKNQKAKYTPSGSTDLPVGLLGMHRINKLQSPRTFYSHFLFRHLPKDFIDRRGKVISVIRDFRDVTTSYYYFFKEIIFDLPWDEFLNFMIDGKLPYGCWFDWMDNIEDVMTENPDYPLLLLRYEDLQRDLKGEIERIADFLEVQLDETKISEITEACRFEVMKKFKSTLNIKEGITPIKSKDNAILFRKGICGDWKNIFTVAQSEKVKEIMMSRQRTGSRFNYLDEG